MSYIGNEPTTVAFLTDTFSGNGSTTAFTMQVAPATTSSVLVAITGVVQDPSTYAVSGTTLTFSAAPPTGTSNISVRYLGIPASGVTTTAYRTVTEFTATAGQTTFSVPSYTVGYIDVYRNGSRLGAADYTATTGTSVVLAAAASAGDLVTTESFYVSSVLNAIPATAGAVNSTYIANGAVGNTQMASGAARANFGAGAVLQVSQTVKVDTYSSTATTWTDVTGVSLSIVPASASNKVLISLNIAVGSSSATPDIMLRIVRDSTAIALGNNGGTDQLTITPFTTATSATTESYRSMASTVQFLDSPATTSAVTYKIQMRNWSNGDTYFVGRRGLNASFIEPTFLTAMEIAG